MRAKSVNAGLRVPGATVGRHPRASLPRATRYGRHSHARTALPPPRLRAAPTLRDAGVSSRQMQPHAVCGVSARTPPGRGQQPARATGSGGRRGWRRRASAWVQSEGGAGYPQADACGLGARVGCCRRPGRHAVVPANWRRTSFFLPPTFVSRDAGWDRGVPNRRRREQIDIDRPRTDLPAGAQTPDNRGGQP